jgi:hypothetical protein
MSISFQSSKIRACLHKHGGENYVQQPHTGFTVTLQRMGGSEALFRSGQIQIDQKGSSQVHHFVDTFVSRSKLRTEGFLQPCIIPKNANPSYMIARELR